MCRLLTKWTVAVRKAFTLLLAKKSQMRKFLFSSSKQSKVQRNPNLTSPQILVALSQLEPKFVSLEFYRLVYS